MALLGLALAAVVVGTVLIAPQGAGVGLPDQVDFISPTSGAIVLRQVRLEIDMAAGYEIVLFVDGLRIPEDQILVTEQTGYHRWQPSSDTATPEWAPGDHTIRIDWDTTSGNPDPGSLTWSFRTQ